jgi:threonine synthase
VTVSRFVCAGCGDWADPAEPFRCRNAAEDDIDHVLRRELDLSVLEFPVDDHEPNPFLRYRDLLHAYHLGLDDAEFCRLVDRLDREVAAVDGHGFTVTPFARNAELSDRFGFSQKGGVWVKDETGNVCGSHKARHLFGVLVFLEVAERVGLADFSDRELAIASCGNAALAAAVVAAAGGRALRVFVPPEAEPVVLERLEELGARVVTCVRDGRPGDPAYRRLREALEEGALPFTCQGNLNGLAIEGGETLGWELASSGVALDRVIVQVGGGALASACSHAFREAAALGAIAAPPRIDTVQTEGAWPLKRAFDELAQYPDLGYARTHRSEFMWPWEQEPRSIATGILDDETYDWLAVVEGMLATGGRAVVASERTIAAANRLAQTATGIDVDPTGSAGLAGLLTLVREGGVSRDERVALLFTGVVRQDQTKERSRDEKLSRTRHPVAQGLRAG